MDLVLDIGNFRLKGALFERGNLVEPFAIPFEMERLKNGLGGKTIERCLVSSVNAPKEKEVLATLDGLGVTADLLDFSAIGVKLEVDEPEALGADRIANVYGALAHFPQNDCIVVDMGSAVTFDFVGADGSYQGGAIYPGVDIGAKALDAYTTALPLVEVERPDKAIAKTTKTHIQSGLYWGLLGAIERIISEMRQEAKVPSNVKVLATGGLLSRLSPEPFAKDLSDLVDSLDPHLTLIGLYEILKEIKKDV